MPQHRPRSQRSLTLLLSLGACLAACSDADPPLSVQDATLLPSAVAAGDASPEHFHFLPPLAAQPDDLEALDQDREPEVRICRLEGDACAETVAEFTTEGQRSERVRLNGDHYIVNWHTGRYDVPESAYRITVTEAGCTWGQTEIALRRGGRSGESTTETFTLGQTLPIRFWAGEGAGTCPSFEIVDFISDSTGTLHFNPQDAVVLTLPAGDGEVIQYFTDPGDDSPDPRIRGFAKLDLDDPAATDVLLVDDEGRISKIYNRDGSTLEIEYLSEDEARVTITLGPEDDGEQGVVFVDLNEAEAMMGYDGPTTSAAPAQRTSADSAEVMARWGRRIDEAFDAEPLAVTTTDDSGVRTVRASVRAGSDGSSERIAGALVHGRWGTTSEWGIPLALGYLPFREVSRGEHVAHFPIHPMKDGVDFLNDVCTSVEDWVRGFCQAVKASKRAVRYACLMSAVKLGPKFATACWIGREIADEGCNLVRDGTDICEFTTNAIDRFLPDAGSVNLNVSARLGFQSLPTQNQQHTAPVPLEMSFDFLFPLQVRLTIQPSNPAPFEGYLAQTSVYPAIAGMSVVSRMSGSDGYSQTRTGTTDSNGTFGMYVPGAEDGVRDDIETQVAGVTRRKSIVFGN